MTSGHGVHVDAGHKDRHEGEAAGAEASGTLAEAKLEIAGDGVGLGDVVEGHHDDAQKEHGRDRADPVPVGSEHTVLVGGAGPSHEFQRAKIGGDEAEAGDPGAHLAAGEEELFAGISGTFNVEADEQDHAEVENQDEDVGRTGKVGQLAICKDQRGNSLHDSFLAWADRYDAGGSVLMGLTLEIWTSGDGEGLFLRPKPIYRTVCADHRLCLAGVAFAVDFPGV